MTLKELSKRYQISESTIKSHFDRVQKKIEEEHGIRIVKIGRGVKASYEEEDDRALTIYEETGKVLMNKDAFANLSSIKFLITLAVIFCPMQTYRGTPLRLSQYLGLKNYEKFLQALEELTKEDYLVCVHDEDYIILSLRRKKEKQIGINLSMLGICTDIAESNGKREWIPLLKLWVGLQTIYDEQPFTTAELSELTGLSEYQIRENKKLLESADIAKTKKVTVSKIDAHTKHRIFACLGQELELNGVVDNAIEERDKVDSLEHLRGDIWK